ncbi:MULTISPECIES: sugar transferase [unclassified Dietzia]|uniref:sugar transferase n=1 Tax=unclassified Dietzia TaxID=2617939 RepID=UPI000D215F63|nr:MULTISPECIES: sugar transferase [unclassified Dietzia]AVZ40300.1 sugar transferase [Dietzia sp. JS16-p6b]
MSDSAGPIAPRGLSRRQQAVKRAFDLIVAVPGFLILLPLVAAAVVAATFDTGEWGVFTQQRIGRYGKLFRVHKIRSMRTSGTHDTTVTTSSDPRITRLGAALRRSKVDELPQLWDVITGQMSLVGPRPDVPGWADELRGEDRLVLSMRPGITGPSSLAFKDEERTLSEADDPEKLNRDVIWPEKVRLNREYIENWTFKNDLTIILRTVGAKK